MFGRHRIGARELIGIGLSADNLKIAYIRDSLNRREVVSLIEKNISGLSDENISKAISSFFSELRVKNPYIIDAITSDMIITKNIEIPSVNAGEIKEIVNLQASRHTPYSREEIIIDYVDIGSYKNSYTKVLLVIVTRNIVKRHFEILNRTGRRLEKVTLAPEGLARSASKILKVETKDSPANIVHIDASSTDFIIVFKDKTVFVRNIPIGAQHLVSKEERYQVRFVEEIKRSLEAYQSENIEKAPASLLLTGAVEELKGMDAILGNAVHLPATIMPYSKNLIISDKAQEGISAAKQSSFLNVIAPIFAYEELKVDLIPEEVKLRRSLEERGKDLIKTGIFILTIFVLVFSILISKIYFKSTYLKNLNNKYQPLNQEAQKLENDFTSVGLIRGYLSGRGYSLEVLAELHKIIPPDLRLNNIRFDEKEKLSLRGTAASMSIVFSFVGDMEKSKYFKEVKASHTTKRKEGSRDVTDFEIICQITKGAD